MSGIPLLAPRKGLLRSLRQALLSAGALRPSSGTQLQALTWASVATLPWPRIRKCSGWQHPGSYR
eukprot:6322976-Alexandrium_andersonii.AAC.1